VSDPSHQNLGESERKGTDHGIGRSAADEPGRSEEKEQKSFEAPLRSLVWLELLVDGHVLLALLGRFFFADDSEAFEYFFSRVGVQSSRSGEMLPEILSEILLDGFHVVKDL
jgi:hypothetical protein